MLCSAFLKNFQVPLSCLGPARTSSAVQAGQPSLPVVLCDLESPEASTSSFSNSPFGGWNWLSRQNAPDQIKSHQGSERSKHLTQNFLSPLLVPRTSWAGGSEPGLGPAWAPFPTDFFGGIFTHIWVWGHQDSANMLIWGASRSQQTEDEFRALGIGLLLFGACGSYVDSLYGSCLNVFWL